jgi:hypothetical protein
MVAPRYKALADQAQTNSRGRTREAYIVEYPSENSVVDVPPETNQKVVLAHVGKWKK